MNVHKIAAFTKLQKKKKFFCVAEPAMKLHVEVCNMQYVVVVHLSLLVKKFN